MSHIESETNRTGLHLCASVALGAAVLAATCALSSSVGLKPVFAQASNQTDHAPSGWFLAGDRPASYRTGIDKDVVRDALPSAYLASKVQETGGFGTLMQSIAASQYAGQRVRLHAWVQSKDVADWAGLWMRVDKGKATVGFDNMQDRPIHGTQPWTAYDVVLDVPANATYISFGTLLAGSGAVWLNGVQFEVVGQDVRTTGTAGASPPPATPVNLDFQK
jgi:hypothetical protein